MVGVYVLALGNYCVTVAAIMTAERRLVSTHRLAVKVAEMVSVAVDTGANVLATYVALAVSVVVSTFAYRFAAIVAGVLSCRRLVSTHGSRTDVAAVVKVDILAGGYSHATVFAVVSAL